MTNCDSCRDDSRGVIANSNNKMIYSIELELFKLVIVDLFFLNKIEEEI